MTPITASKTAYLTIDDGPSLHRAQKLAILKAKNIPCVFFSEGRWIEDRPELAMQTIKEGFVLGNHSYSHPAFSGISLTACCEEIQRTDAFIHTIYCEAGIPNHPRFFRFPYGDKGDGQRGRFFGPSRKKDNHRHDYIQACLRELGYTQPDFKDITHPFYLKAGLDKDFDWHWTFDPMEWALSQSKPKFGIGTKEKVLQRIASRYPRDTRGFLFFQKRWIGNPTSAELIVMHDHDETGAYFGEMIDALLDLGLVFGDFVK
jgi:peptidoglycan-N-acetylglucosamine deacetylase